MTFTCLIAGLVILMLPMLVQRLNRLELLNFEERQLGIQQDRSKSGITLVEIDDASLNHPELKQVFGRYPWRREIYAYLIRFMERGHAKATVFEPTFNGGADLEHPQSDQRFGESITPNMPVIVSLAAARKQDLRPYESPIDREHLFEALNRGRLYPHGEPLPYVKYYDAYQIPIIPLLKSEANIFPSDNLIFDQNGRVRQFNLFGWGKARKLRATIPVAVVMEDETDVYVEPGGKLLLNKHLVDLHGESKPIIKWYGDVANSEHPVYPRYSLAQIIKSQIYTECKETPGQPICRSMNFKGFQPLDPAVFSNRYVMVGYYSSWYDSNAFSTLYDDLQEQGHSYPNLFIQANILDNLLNNDFVARPGWRIPFPYISPEPVSLVTAGIALIMFMLTFIAVHRFKCVFISLAFTLLLGIAYTWLTQAAYHHYNLWLNWIYPITTLGCTYGGTYLYRFTHMEKRKQQLRQAFSKYMSPASMAYIEENMDTNRLMSQRHQLTYMFCDIRGFTRFAEQNTPTVVQSVLTDYFTQMNSIIIHEYKGVINKLIGDAILAYWGFPIEREDDPYLAVCAALAMKEVAEQWQKDPNKPSLKIGIGINSGEAMVGDIGSHDFMDFTVIGDSVNIASRLEKLNKQFGTTIIISKATYDQVSDRIEARYIGKVKLPGRNEPLEIYEPLGLRIYSDAPQATKTDVDLPTFKSKTKKTKAIR